MKAVDLATFDGFRDEFLQAAGQDAVEVYFRERLRQAGVQTLYVSQGSDGLPMFAQWVVKNEEQHLLHTYRPGQAPTLRIGEVLLDGGYTFARFRGCGAMGDGLRQVLQIARNEGATRAYAYVWEHNIPSLRACAKVGFRPVHMMAETRRFARIQTDWLPAGEEWKRKWRAAVLRANALPESHGQSSHTASQGYLDGPSLNAS
jgi:hypothetical protein